MVVWTPPPSMSGSSASRAAAICGASAPSASSPTPRNMLPRWVGPAPKTCCVGRAASTTMNPSASTASGMKSSSPKAIVTCAAGTRPACWMSSLLPAPIPTSPSQRIDLLSLISRGHTSVFRSTPKLTMHASRAGRARSTSIFAAPSARASCTITSAASSVPQPSPARMSLNSSRSGCLLPSRACHPCRRSWHQHPRPPIHVGSVRTQARVLPRRRQHLAYHPQLRSSPSRYGHAGNCLHWRHAEWCRQLPQPHPSLGRRRRHPPCWQRRLGAPLQSLHESSRRPTSSTRFLTCPHVTPSASGSSRGIQGDRKSAK